MRVRLSCGKNAFPIKHREPCRRAGHQSLAPRRKPLMPLRELLIPRIVGLATARTPTGMQSVAGLFYRRIFFALTTWLTCVALGYGVFMALGLDRKSWVSAECLI